MRRSKETLWLECVVKGMLNLYEKNESTYQRHPFKSVSCQQLLNPDVVSDLVVGIRDKKQISPQKHPRTFYDVAVEC